MIVFRANSCDSLFKIPLYNMKKKDKLIEVYCRRGGSAKTGEKCRKQTAVPAFDMQSRCSTKKKGNTPMDYDTKLINLALDAGELMLSSGAETYRVQDTMKRILSVAGREKIEALAMCTLLIVTLPREEKGPLSMARAVKSRAVNFEKICAVNDMSRAFVSGQIDIDTALMQCHEIYNAPNFSFTTRVLGYAINGAGFAVMVGGQLIDGLVSFFVALLMGISLVSVEDRKVPFFLGPLLGGLVTGLAACLAHLLLPETRLDKMIIGTMKALLPGLALSKAMRDLLEGNLISGNSRVVEVLLNACSIAAGVAIALTIFHMS